MKAVRQARAGRVAGGLGCNSLGGPHLSYCFLLCLEISNPEPFTTLIIIGFPLSTTCGIGDTLTEKRALCSVRVTLDGKSAVIGGVLNDFATVAQTPQGLAVEFAWDTVRRVVDKGGAFRS